MPRTTTLENEPVPHNVQINDRNHMEITSVIEICAFDESEVLLKTGRGRMCIKGKSLHVTSLSPESGKAVVDGTIDTVTYAAANTHSIFGKIFG